MAVSVPSRDGFFARFPQFGKTPVSLIDQVLAEAAERTNEDIYDSATQLEAVYLQAAVKLSTIPDARTLQLVNEDHAKVWRRELFRLQRAATQGIRVF